MHWRHPSAAETTGSGTTMGDDVTIEHPPFPAPRACPFGGGNGQAAGPDARPDAGPPLRRVTLPTGATAWVVTGHERVRRLLADPRVSADRRRPGFPHLAPVPVGNPPDEMLPMVTLDPPEHTAHRRMFVNEFTVRRMRLLRPRIQTYVDACVDDLLAGDRPADLVQAISVPVPSMAVCELLGVPYEDRDFFKSRTRTLLDRSNSAEDMRAGFGELLGYFDKLITAKEEDPGDDLLGRAIVKYREAGRHHHGYMVNTALMLLNAGHETTTNMISLAVVALLENPEQLAELRANPALTAHAVEELLRYFSVVDLTVGRVATADIELDGETIRAGEGVIAQPSSANLDADVFADPYRIDIHREEARRHVAFGHGSHNCLGQNLAREELEIVINTLFARIPDLRLAKPADELSFKDGEQVYGIHEVPVTW
nr:cytochrome P450 [Micromonospora sp.]